MKPKYSFDRKCFELAEHFTDDLPNNEHTIELRRKLAQSIQDAIEEHLYCLLEASPTPQHGGES